MTNVSHDLCTLALVFLKEQSLAKDWRKIFVSRPRPKLQVDPISEVKKEDEIKSSTKLHSKNKTEHSWEKTHALIIGVLMEGGKIYWPEICRSDFSNVHTLTKFSAGQRTVRRLLLQRELTFLTLFLHKLLAPCTLHNDKFDESPERLCRHTQRQTRSHCRISYGSRQSSAS